MTETQKPKMVWYSPQALANRANDGFLSIVRSTEKGICSIPSSTGKGFLSIVRFTGKATRFIQSNAVNSTLKIGQVLFRKGKKNIKQETEPMKEESLPQDASLEAAADAQQGDAPSPVNSEAGYAESKPDSVAEEEPQREEIPQEVAEEIQEKEDVPEKAVASEPQMTVPPQQTEPVAEEFLAQDASPEANADAQQGDAPFPANGEAEYAGIKSDLVVEEEPPQDEEMEQDGPQYPSLELEALLKQHSPRDRVEGIRLRQALDDLLHGSEAARLIAMKTLVGLHQVAEPFLVASLQIASPQVVEIALGGLSQIGSQRLIGCISDVLASSDPELRIVALRAAQRLRDEEARPFLERGLQDSSTRVKRRVLSYLSWHDSSWALAQIWGLCDDPEPDVKWAALEALLAVRPSEAYDNLELMMPSLDPAYRRRVLTLLKQRKSLLSKDGDTPLVLEEEPPQAEVSLELSEEIPEKEEAPEEVVVSELQITAPSQNEQQTEPVAEEFLPQDASPEAAADAQQENTPFTANGKVAVPEESLGDEEISEEEETPERAVASELQMTAPSQNEQQTEPVAEEFLPQDASPEAAADAQQGDAPFPANGEPAESTPASVTEEEPPQAEDHSVMKRWSKRGRNILHWS